MWKELYLWNTEKINPRCVKEFGECSTEVVASGLKGEPFYDYRRE